MTYADWYFYGVVLLISELTFLAASYIDPELKMLRRCRPIAWQIVILLLTAAALYGSDSNKPSPPEKPIVKQSRVYIHRGNGGGRWVPIGVNTVDRSTIKQSKEKNSNE